MIRQLVLSLFPGVGLLDKAFIDSGFCVVQAADKLTGGDIVDFIGMPRRFDGIIAGPPCQGFSIANSHRLDETHHSVIMSRELMRHTCRIIEECKPAWFLVENVPCVPDIRVRNYSVQRIPITDFECGGPQFRCRHIQFGSVKNHVIRPTRVNDCTRNRRKGRRIESVTTKTSIHVDFPDLCKKQGLKTVLTLEGWSKKAKFRAVGNGVPLTIGKVLADAVKQQSPFNPDTDCQCGCGRIITKRAITATAACRKRRQICREKPRPWIDADGYHD